MFLLILINGIRLYSFWIKKDNISGHRVIQMYYFKVSNKKPIKVSSALLLRRKKIKDYLLFTIGVTHNLKELILRMEEFK